ncbi:MAG: SDR family NAD(P)-dependent oxidoreductase [Parvibaculum sp.]|uniref:SDR family NAD(P)-dependent oxidoreductase n=1 Tax=Parvibaculum sp. TaxID=2024848 RepID=UPI0025EFE44F|nr:SDR family NAD(P)-dependent oxidoreductase [Parvibaculum sp.]MCE9649631.1 SDR family NAD(P)-dependent oxidoreductase [Parvibaculum sp.]
MNMPQTAPKTALVIGATGGIGSETALALLARGWKIRALNRNPARAARDMAHLGNIEWVKGDAMSPADVIAAAKGVSLVVHAANPPGYKNWVGTVLPMLESSIAAAKSAGARLVFPGAVYNFGPETFPLVDETAPQRPRTRKGALRVAMEQRLKAASEEGTPVLIVRAGDFFGPCSTGNNTWFSAALVKPGKPVRSVTYPGPHKVGHAWAFVPDLAETIARLVDREADLGAFDVFHFGGHWFDKGVDIAHATARAAGVPDAPIKRLPWPALYLAALFSETLREMLEMRYLWKKPVQLDNRKLVAFLGHEPHTPTEQALRVTLAGLGCLETSSAPRAQLAIEGKA